MTTHPAEPWSSAFSETDTAKIHYRRTGQDGPTLVALHGLMGSGAVWTPFARALGDAFDLVTPDARGHGRSSVPSDGYMYDDHADDVCGLISALDLSKPVLVGHSMGGMTAALVASRLGSELGGLILVDPTFISPEWQQEVYESDVFAQHRQFLLTDRDDLIAEARGRNTSRSSEMIEIVTDSRLGTDIKALEVLAPPNPDFRSLVASIRAPTLLVLGGRGIVSLETAQELESLNPSLRHDMIEDAGHAIPYDEPERLALLVKRFVDGLTAPSP
jgi:pimeloyl-ACP methyl ester carboxylesterase